MRSRLFALMALCCLFVAGCEDKADACDTLAFSQCYAPQAVVQQYAVPLAVQQYVVPQQQVFVQKQFVQKQAIVAYPQAVVAYPQAVVVQKQRLPRRSVQRQRIVTRSR